MGEAGPGRKHRPPAPLLTTAELTVPPPLLVGLAGTWFGHDQATSQVSPAWTRAPSAAARFLFLIQALVEHPRQERGDTQEKGVGAEGRHGGGLWGGDVTLAWVPRLPPVPVTTVRTFLLCPRNSHCLLSRTKECLMSSAYQH